jgi:hypothetical protein
VPAIRPLRERALDPQVAWPENDLPTAGGHGGDGMGEANVQVVLTSGTVSDVRKTPELLNARVAVAAEGFHCSLELEAVEVTARVWAVAGRAVEPLLVVKVVDPLAE